MEQTGITPIQIKRFVQLFEEMPAEGPLCEIVSEATAEKEKLSPWHFWLLVCLARHHVRQNWVADIIKYRLGGDLNLLANAGASGHPEIPQQGLVPKDSEWEYYFHGCGCCLTHRGTGEEIDVDFFDNSGDYFSIWFYEQYLKSLKSAQFPEQRLIQLHSSFDSLKFTEEELCRSVAFEQHTERNVYKLSAQIIQCIPRIEAFCARLTESEFRKSIAIPVGDWLLARDLLAVDVAEQARRCEVERIRAAELLLEFPEKRTLALAVIHDVSAQDARDCIVESLERPTDRAVGYALELINESGDSSWCPFVFNLFQKTNPHSGMDPDIWTACATFLLEQGCETEATIGRFQEIYGFGSTDAALLAMRYAPQHALTLFRDALRSSVPINRIQASAMLAIIDQPWSRKELKAILSDFDDQEMTLYARAALLAGMHEEDHAFVTEWESVNPYEPETGKYISIREHSIRAKDSTITWYMQKFHDQLWPLRNTKVD